MSVYREDLNDFYVPPSYHTKFLLKYRGIKCFAQNRHIGL